MNSSSLASWVYGGSSFLYLLFYIGAFIFLAVNRDRNRRAAKLAIFGIGIMFVLRLVSMLVPLFLARAIDMDSFVIYNAFLQLGFSVCRLAAFALILAAVFVGRQPPDQQEAFAFDPSQSNNPYVPPTTR